MPPLPEEETILAVHVPGQGVLDTACGSTVIGKETLKLHEEKLGAKVKWFEKFPPMSFRYGNGTSHAAIGMVSIPTVLKGVKIDIIAHVVPGQVPFLLSKKWMTELGAILDIPNSSVELKTLNITARVDETETGFMGLDLISGAQLSDFPQGRTHALRSRK